MKTLYESSVLRITLETEAPIIVCTWLPTTFTMTEATYKEEMHQVADFQINYNSHKPLVDIRDFQFVVTPPIQQWVDQNILGNFVKAGISKVAYIASSDVFAQIAVEQLMEEQHAATFKVQYFKDYNKARSWLLMD